MKFLAGLAILLLMPIVTLAQATGEVESIGFDNHYRPNCWTPMVIRLVPEKSGTYQIRVKQQDLDRDLPVFGETIFLTAVAEGRSPEQRFWMYFLPQPTDGGLMDSTRGGTLKELQEQLHVYLCDKDGKQLNQLLITQTITNLDASGGSSGYGPVPRGAKLILAVAEGRSQLMWRDYQAQNTIGLLEDIVMVTLPPAALPEDIRGYDAVDGIVWLNAPVPDPTVPTEEKRHRALQDYVRSGGRLVICQPPQRESTAAFGDLLPVNVTAIAEKSDLSPLSELAASKNGESGDYEWRQPTGPFRFARAEPREGAIVDTEIEWSKTDHTPYIVRAGYGLGSVTWVANDLGDPAITSKARTGWPHVWDHVLDLRNDTLTINTNQASEDQARLREPYETQTFLDLGPSLNRGMELQSKTRSLVSLAVLFFIAYWVVAGPGVYIYLVSKSRSQLSWFLFAASAIVATVLTVLLVDLVVRGAPELHHVTIVRKAGDGPAIMLSRFGLYIPRDGPQEIALKNLSPTSVSYITPFPAHPSHISADEGFTANFPYDVPVHEAADVSATIRVPYRRTLKKLAARWVGTMNGGVDGKPELRRAEGSPVLQGVLVNSTGQKLINIYFAFKEGEQDTVYYLPSWNNGVTIDLASEFGINKSKSVGYPGESNTMSALPENGVKLWGFIGRTETYWSRYWYYDFKNVGFGGTTYDDTDKPVKRSFPVMSLFDCLPPSKNQDRKQNRFELLRRGGRQLDCSPAVSAGELVVLAEAEGEAPLPFPLEVEGERVAGKGTIYYQFVLPMAHTSTPPATQPATAPVAKGIF